MNSISLKELAERMQLVDYTPEIPLEDIEITTAELNRPALQLTGFMEHFDNTRIQIVGNVEYTYLESLSQEEQRTAYARLLACHIPCLILARGRKPSEALLALAFLYRVPLLGTAMRTSQFEARLLRQLEICLAPMVAIHGVLVDVFGEGVLQLPIR